LKDVLYRQRYRIFLERLRQARVDAHPTQIEVVRNLRRPRSFVSESESGERRIDAIELTEFARLYGKPLNFFVS